MKNIHVLSTNKQSRLWVNNLRRRLELDEFHSKHQTNIAKHIYITSDELTKECYMYDIDGDVGKAIGSDMKEFEGNKKIILTTDLDLIADGVQAIPDDFLEWFVKNPSCEEVKVNNLCYGALGGFADAGYKIILPQEEDEQDDSRVHLKHCYQGEYKDSCKYGEDDCPTKPLEEPKQILAVDIEQASIELVQDGTIEGYYDTFAYYEKKGFVKGVEWHKKRSYSEEEAGELVYNIIGEYAKEYGITIDGAKLNDLFNQLKKQ
jgi:hypothetical protein